MQILDCRYSDAYAIINKSETYYWLVQKDYAEYRDINERRVILSIRIRSRIHLERLWNGKIIVR